MERERKSEREKEGERFARVKVLVETDLIFHVE